MLFFAFFFAFFFSQLLVLLLQSATCLSNVLPRDEPRLVLELAKDTRIEYIHAGRFGSFPISTINSSTILESNPLTGSVDPLLSSPLNDNTALSGIAIIDSSAVGTYIKHPHCVLQNEITTDGNLNSITSIPGTPFTFSADSTGGRIIRANWTSPDVELVTVAENLFGINDIKYHDGYFYFTNVLDVLFQRIKIDPTSGFPLEDIPETLAVAPVEALMGFDAFDMDSEGNSYLAVGIYVMVAPGHGGLGTFIRSILNPTSVALSFDGKVVYVVTARGQVFAMDAI